MAYLDISSLHASHTCCVNVFAIYVIYLVNLFLCRNHSWVSFQGFAEAYNDAFDLPSNLGKRSHLIIYLNEQQLA